MTSYNKKANSFDLKIQEPGLKFNARLALNGLRTTGPGCTLSLNVN